MKKLDKIEILKNVGSSWFSLGLNILAGLFLSPYILHRLGDAAFGLWVLVFSITGYYGLFDLGIRSSIVRYVASYSANNWSFCGPFGRASFGKCRGFRTKAVLKNPLQL